MKLRHALPAVALLAILSRFPILQAGFITVDDPSNIYENAFNKGPFLEGLWRFWSEPYYKLYIPFTYSAWLVIAKITTAVSGEIRPFLYHFFNVALHASSSMVVFLSLRSMLDALAPPPKKGKHAVAAPDHSWPALAGAAFFALHPLQSEAIYWATGARDLLAAHFALWALYCFFRKGPQPGLKTDLLVLTFFLLAVLSKPSAIVLPAIVYAVNALVYRYQRERVLKRLLPWFAVSTVLAIAQKTMQTDELIDAVASLWERPVVALDALGHYVGRILVPWNLALDYTRTPARIFHDPWTVLHVGLALAALGLIWKFKRTWAPAAIFVLSMLPVSGLLAFDHQNFSTVTDRYVYFAMLGPALGLALALASLLKSPAHSAASGGLRVRRLVPWVLAPLALAYCALDVQLALAWQDSEVLFSRLVRIQPDSYLAHFNQALTARKRKDYVAELAHLQSAHNSRPRAIEPIYAIGVAMGDSGRLPEALAFFADVLKREAPGTDPLSRANFSKIHYNYAVMLVRAHRIPEARAEIQRALELDPGSAMIRAAADQLR